MSSSACPNTDPSFTLLRTLLGRAATPSERTLAFWGVCVPFRFLLYLWISYNAQWTPVRVAVMAAGLAAGLRLVGAPLDGPWWWSKRFQALMGFALFLGAAAGWRAYPVFLWGSLLGGVALAAVTRFC